MADIERPTTDKGEPKLIVTDPEYTLSVIGLVASFCGQPIVGLIISSIALRRSREAARHNTYALVGFILSIVLLGFWLLLVGLYAALIAFSIALHLHN